MPKNIQKLTGKRASLHGNRSVRSTSITSHHFKPPIPTSAFWDLKKTAAFLSQGWYHPPRKTNGVGTPKKEVDSVQRSFLFQGVIFRFHVCEFCGAAIVSCFEFSLHQFSFHFINKNLDKGHLGGP